MGYERGGIQITRFGATLGVHLGDQVADHNDGYARASYASGGGGTSRVPRIAGDVIAGSALTSCVPVGDALCAERRRL